MGRKPTHGDSSSKEYRCWCGIKTRCFNTKHIAYKNYGLRGIGMCERWQCSYGAFLLDVGRAPSEAHSLDRIDGSVGYEPGNIRWATQKEQANNPTNRKKPKKQMPLRKKHAKRVPYGPHCRSGRILLLGRSKTGLSLREAAGIARIGFGHLSEIGRAHV